MEKLRWIGVGLILFLGGLYFLYLGRASHDAKSLDLGPITLASVKRCESLLVSTTIDRRVISESETAVVRATLLNRHRWPCTVRLAFTGAAFDVSPSDAETTTIQAGESRIFHWTISPRRLGTHQIGVLAGSEEWILGVSVVTTLGLPAWLWSVISGFVMFATVVAALAMLRKGKTD